MKLSVKFSPIGKPDEIGGLLTYKWLARDINPADLVKHITSGKPFAVAQYKGGHKKKENFAASEAIALDYDGLTPDEYAGMIAHPFIQQNAFAVIPTFSDRADQRRARVLFRLNQTISDYQTYSDLVRLISEYAPAGADTAAADAARAFCGSKPGTEASFFSPFNVLDITPFLDELLQRQEARALARQNHPLPADLPSDFIGAIEKALGAGDYNKEGWSALIRCPFGNHEHDDTRPAGAWNKDSHIFHCRKCRNQQTYLAIEVADRVGIERPQKAYIAPDVDLSIAPDIADLSALKTGDIELYHLPKTPDMLRRSLMGLSQQFEQYEDQTPALICLEAIYEAIRAGDFDPAGDVITRRWLVNYGSRGVKETTARTGLDQLAALGFLTRIEGSTAAQYKLLPISNALANMRRVVTSQYRQKSYPAEAVFSDYETILPIPADITPGMIALEYPHLTDQQLEQGAEALNQYRAGMYQEFAGERTEAAHRLDNEVKRLGAVFSLEGLLTAPSTHLAQDDTWENSSAYRASFYRARVQWRHNRNVTITQKQAAEEMGISPKSLYSLRLKHGIALDEQFEEIPVKAPAAVFEVMPKWAARRDYGNKLVSSSKNEVKNLAKLDRQEVKEWVAAEIRGGHSVTLRVQTASLERFATAEERAANETKAEAQKEAARRRRNDYQNRRRDQDARLQLNRVEIALQETIQEFDPRWVKEQLDLRPGWELLLDGIALGAVIQEPANFTDRRLEALSSIGNFRRLPDTPPATNVLPFKRRESPASELNPMWNLPYWEAAVGNL